MSVRFSPDACPGCGDPLRPKYSTYRHGTRGLLFPAGLICGLFAALTLCVLSLWGTAEFTLAVLGDAQLTRREMGMMMCLFYIPVLGLVVYTTRVGWRLLHRLPRTFTAGCETCSWTGPCNVYDTEI